MPLKALLSGTAEFKAAVRSVNDFGNISLLLNCSIYPSVTPWSTLVEGRPPRVSLFPRLLASTGLRVIVIDVNFGDMVPGAFDNVILEPALATRQILSDILKKYNPSRISCVSVLEHAPAEQQQGIFEAIETSFNGKNAVFTMEFHETETHFEQQLTTRSLSDAVTGLHRYFLDRIERSPMHCVDALRGQSRLWYPLALRFRARHAP